MATPQKLSGSTNVGLLLARLPVGVLFVWEGYLSLKAGLGNFVTANVSHVPRYMPSWFGENFLKAAPFAMILFGLMICVGFLTRFAGFFTSLLLISFLMVLGAKDPLAGSYWPFNPNFIFLGVALLTMFAGAGGLSLDALLFGGKSSKNFD